MNFLRKRFIFSLKYLLRLLNIVSLHFNHLKSEKLLWKQKMAFVSRLIKERFGMPLLPQCYCTLRHPHPDAVDKTES